MSALLEKFLRNFAAVFRELYEDPFVQAHIHFRGIVLVARVFPLHSQFLFGR
jgi:hypothetical protein